MVLSRPNTTIPTLQKSSSHGPNLRPKGEMTGKGGADLVDERTSGCVEMLNGKGQGDTADNSDVPSFKTDALNHSATLPVQEFQPLMDGVVGRVSTTADRSCGRLLVGRASRRQVGRRVASIPNGLVLTLKPLLPEVVIGRIRGEAIGRSAVPVSQLALFECALDRSLLPFSHWVLTKCLKSL